jgi:chromosomal replication initiation ATPase DnaA
MGRDSSQIPIPLEHRPQLSRDDFLVSPSNQAALELIERWPDWPARLVSLFGPPGSGKSHLVNIWKERSGATETGLGPDAREPASGPCYIENIDMQWIDEKKLFHLINHVAESGGHLLLTARTPVTDWAITLPDLLSRLRLAAPVHLETPDDTLLRLVLVKLFADRQLLVDKAVIDYLLKRMERSLDAARSLVDAIDREALVENRRISRNLAARVFERLTDDPKRLDV